MLYKKSAAVIPVQEVSDRLIRNETHLSREIARVANRLVRLQRIRKRATATAPRGHQDFLIPRAGNQLLRSRAGPVSFYARDWLRVREVGKLTRVPKVSVSRWSHVYRRRALFCRSAICVV
jgi:hypothetical protein